MSAARVALDWELWRLRSLLGAMMAGFALLGVTLWRQQVAHGRRFEEDLARQSVRRVRLPGIRGSLVDRHGAPLAENRPGYGIALYLEELRRAGSWGRTVERVDRTIDELSARLGLPRAVTTEEIKTHVRRRLPLPLFAWRDVGEEALARWAEGASALPGVDLYPEPVRVYPQGRTAGHLLGYVGRAEVAEEPEDPYHYYLPEMGGKSGLEKSCDALLRGEAGGRLVRVDVSGFRHGDLGTREPKAGHDVMLTLDLRIQRCAEAALEGTSGAAVVLDPRSGEVLALASAPGYDPNAFVPSIPVATWRALADDPERPLLNRAVAGAYPPGSTFKPLVAVAALAAGRASAATAFHCPGHFELGRARFDCWYRPGHGTIRMQEALRDSCNVYFFRLALAAGPEAVQRAAEAVGLGRRTGIDLDYEVPGLVPTDAWKRRAWRDAWRDGDTCNLAIGQGALVATPLQMAGVAAALANGGFVHRPHLVRATRAPGEAAFRRAAPPPAVDLAWNPAWMRTVRDGMRDVVMDERGTGRRAAIPGVSVAGKTGTAEYGPKEEGRKRGWMLAFAPFEAPRYAVAMVVEEAESGGLTVAPRMRALLEGLFAAAPGPEGENG